MIADANNDVVKVLDLNTVESSTANTAAVLEGGNAQ